MVKTERPDVLLWCEAALIALLQFGAILTALL